ncbi:competence protein TfoX, partial [Coprobacillus cateniformis]|nr:competence protein TfoX [Coprobacillus cateniformis]
YCDGKVIGLICDNQFFVKKTISGISILPNCEEASPYSNAKPHLVIDSVDNKELMTRFIRATCDELPNPRPKKKK